MGAAHGAISGLEGSFLQNMEPAFGSFDYDLGVGSTDGETAFQLQQLIDLKKVGKGILAAKTGGLSNKILKLQNLQFGEIGIPAAIGISVAADAGTGMVEKGLGHFFHQQQLQNLQFGEVAGAVGIGIATKLGADAIEKGAGAAWNHFHQQQQLQNMIPLGPILGDAGKAAGHSVLDSLNGSFILN